MLWVFVEHYSPSRCFYVCSRLGALVLFVLFLFGGGNVRLGPSVCHRTRGVSSTEARMVGHLCGDMGISWGRRDSST